MLTATTGEAVMAHRFSEYKPWKGQIPGRNNGVLISKNSEKTTGYSIDKLQDRGTFFVDPGEDVYAGQIVAENIKPGDLVAHFDPETCGSIFTQKRPGVVVEVLDCPVYSHEEASNSADFRKPLDLRVGALRAGVFSVWHVSARDFVPYTGPTFPAS